MLSVLMFEWKKKKNYQQWHIPTLKLSSVEHSWSKLKPKKKENTPRALTPFLTGIVSCASLNVWVMHTPTRTITASLYIILFKDTEGIRAVTFSKIYHHLVTSFSELFWDPLSHDSTSKKKKKPKKTKPPDGLGRVISTAESSTLLVLSFSMLCFFFFANSIMLK